MATVVLLRAANVGKRRFSPKALVEALADLDVHSIGAAGTFVVRKRVVAAVLRARIAAELPWDDPEMVVCSDAHLRAAVAAGEQIPMPAGAKRFATAMETKPRAPRIPLEAPAGAGWAVRVVAIEGPFALGVRRSTAETGIYPNEVIEKAYGVRATTRDWPTMEKVGDIIDRWSQRGLRARRCETQRQRPRSVPRRSAACARIAGFFVTP